MKNAKSGHEHYAKTYFFRKMSTHTQRDILFVLLNVYVLSIYSLFAMRIVMFAGQNGIEATKNKKIIRNTRFQTMKRL